MQNVLSGTISVIQCSSSIGTVWKLSSSSECSGVLCSGVLSGSWSWHQCEGTGYDVWLVYDPTSVPRQLRFSLYSGAVITEDLM